MSDEYNAYEEITSLRLQALKFQENNDHEASQACWDKANQLTSNIRKFKEYMAPFIGGII